MRVLHIITGLNNGGAEGALYRLATTCKEHSHHVVSMMGAGVHGPRLAAAGIPVSTLEMPRGSVTLGGLIRLYRLVRTVDPDVVQTWLYHPDLIGGALARLAGKPVVWGIRNTVLARSQAAPTTRWTVKLCARVSGWLPRRIVSCSVRAARDHEDAGYAAGKIVVIANGFDLARIAPDPSARARKRVALGIADDTPLLGMVARWDPQKDHANLASALARLGQDWRCVLIGSDIADSNAALVELLDRHGIRSRCILAGTRSDIVAVMNALDLHVLSSSYGEAFPNVLAEAMACGTPCVATDVGDSGLIVGETGWIVPIKDPAALSLAMEEALAEMPHADRWERRRRAARERVVDKFSIERMVDGYRDVWRAATRRAPE